MRKRNISIITRLNEKEKKHLTVLVKRSGLSQEAYIRHLINGVVPKDSPPADYYVMMKELHAIGNNLNQIARKANQLNVIDAQQYDLAVKQFEKAVIDITEAVILPKPMDK
ncbi:plasmid mobilization protein [Thomasclavelia sp.]